MPKVRRVNTGQYQPSSNSSAIVALPATPPRVSPNRIRAVIACLTVAGFAAIAADCWMSWEGFNTLPVDWWVAATLTGLVAASQLGSGVIQSLGGDPFAGVGGSSQGDGAWSMTLKSLYALDIFSNFSGFGGTDYLSWGRLLGDPGGTIGLVLWHGVLAVLLAFGDEILFRLRDRIEIGAQKNQQLAKIRGIQVAAHNRTLDVYQRRAMEQAAAHGKRVNVDFGFLQGDDHV